MEQIACHVQQWRHLRKKLRDHGLNIIAPKGIIP